MVVTQNSEVVMAAGWKGGGLGWERNKLPFSTIFTACCAAFLTWRKSNDQNQTYCLDLREQRKQRSGNENVEWAWNKQPLCMISTVCCVACLIWRETLHQQHSNRLDLRIPKKPLQKCFTERECWHKCDRHGSGRKDWFHSKGTTCLVCISLTRDFQTAHLWFKIF